MLRRALPLAVLLFFPGPSALASSLSACRSLPDSERLACYDRLPDPSGSNAASSAPTDPAEPSPAPSAQPGNPSVASAPLAFGRISPSDSPPSDSPLSERWELEEAFREPAFTFRPHKPVYILPLFHSARPNQTPCSEGGSPDDCLLDPLDLDSAEAKIQISFKTKAWERPLGLDAAVWLAYTQTSRWQVYNDRGRYSRPFRETDYEPEIIASFPMEADLLGWRLRVLGLSANHQSNGQSEPLSRSWNRVIGFAALERGPWTLTARPWIRIPESVSDDQNPDIEDFVGRGEIVLVRRSGGHSLALTARHSLRLGEDSRGSALFEWAFPLSGSLKGYVQAFHGYGENLQDYNHLQTSLGLGVSLVDWR